MIAHSTRMRMLKLTALLVLSLGLGSLLHLPSSPRAAAQTPTPGNKFIDQRPGSSWHFVPPGASGVVVEGLGASGSCPYNLYDIAQSTAFFVNHGEYTWTEISPQKDCQDVGSYESVISQIINVVEAEAPTAAPALWLGIMLDEEDGFL